MVDWNLYFYYDETSKSCLRWKISRYSGRSYSIEHTEKDSEAGNLVFDENDNPLYIDIRLESETYKAGRVVWEYFYGILSNDVLVDHINGNPHDNRISNLRIVSHAENSRNRKKPSNNTSGKVGVHWTNNKAGKFAMARWCELDGKRKSKSFSVKKFGEDLAFKLACEYRDSKIASLNLQGANYTERHGT